MRALSFLAVGWLVSSSVPALAQMGPGPAHGTEASGPKTGHGPMMEGGGSKGGHGPMKMGGMDDHGDCDAEHCPMMHGHGHGDGPRGGMRMKMIERIADELGVSDAARKNIKDAIYEATKQSIALGAELAQAQLEMHRLMEGDKPDADAVLKLVDKAGQLRTELMKLHVRTMLKIEQQLTPDQRKKLRKRMHGFHHDG